jgi:hypothetical protein
VIKLAVCRLNFESLGCSKNLKLLTLLLNRIRSVDGKYIAANIVLAANIMYENGISYLPLNKNVILFRILIKTL